jgi:hypothetical protein
MGHVMERMNGIMQFEGLHHGIANEIGWFQVQLGEIMEGSGNIPLLVTNEDDDPPQLKLQDVVGSSLVWKGQFLHKTK